MSSSTKRKSLMIGGIIVVVVAVILVVVAVIGSRQGGDETADDTEQSQSSDSAGPAGKFSWKDKQADAFGRMGYLADDPKGQILSTDTRTYSSLEAAEDARPEGIVFQATEFSGGWPIPFSETDGPTGFDGTVPIGYTKSAAGAALATAAYYTQSSMPPTMGEYTEKVLLGAADDQLDAAREQSRKAVEERGTEVTVHGNSPGHYAINAFDGDYASVIIYNTSPSSGRVQAAQFELRWIDGQWKVSGAVSVEAFDTLPEGAQTW